MRRMESLLSGIGIGFAVLLGLAVVVAWWEHLGRRAGPPPWVPPASARAVTVDLPLDALTAPAGDADQRRATLGQAMDRMGQARQPGDAWVETRPMVNPGATTAAPSVPSHTTP